MQGSYCKYRFKNLRQNTTTDPRDMWTGLLKHNRTLWCKIIDLDPHFTVHEKNDLKCNHRPKCKRENSEKKI